MKCKKECIYYVEHDFMASAYKCLLSSKSYKKENKMECIMPLIIEEKKEEILRLEEYMREMKNE